jgi:beta-ribofuranosylaminobenzene 5'-phosphate synthase
MIILNQHNQQNLRLGLQSSAWTDHQLTQLQRIILANDGTVTQLIEQLVGESLQVHKLFESEPAPCLEDSSSERCQRRIVTLNGVDSGIPYLYADSLVFHDHLQVNFSRALLDTRMPIGRAWEKYRVETYKTMANWGFEPADALALKFGILPAELLLYRTYFVYSQGKKIFRITEKFPIAWFRSTQQLTSNTAIPSLLSGV